MSRWQMTESTSSNGRRKVTWRRALKGAEGPLAVLLVIVLVFGLAAALTSFVAWIGMVLYNNAVADHFGLMRVGFLQAWGIVILLSLLRSFISRGSS